VTAADELLPYDRTRLPCQDWGSYVKITVTRAVRMSGYFEVWTREGLMSCDDGWLALDSKGNPYPIAADEFERIYRPAGQVWPTEPKAPL
jgi:hypothetical protein